MTGSARVDRVNLRVALCGVQSGLAFALALIGNLWVLGIPCLLEMSIRLWALSHTG